MFELLDDPAPPVPTPADRQRVLRAGRAHLARRRLATGGLATAGLLTVGLVALALAASGDRPSTVDAVDAPTSTSTSSTTTTTTSVEAASPEDAPTTTTAKATTATSTPTSTQPPTTTTTAAPPRVEPKATRDGRPSVPPRPGVRLTLHLERTSIAAGDTFAGTLTVVNNSSEDVS